jgi:ferredoxin, 2Fe-2S
VDEALSGQVRVEPSGITFGVTEGETVFVAAARHELRWPNICGGQGSCRTCFATVVSGADRCSEPGPWEREGLDTLAAATDGSVRLVCQLEVYGDVTLNKRGVRPQMTE